MTLSNPYSNLPCGKFGLSHLEEVEKTVVVFNFPVLHFQILLFDSVGIAGIV